MLRISMFLARIAVPVAVVVVGYFAMFLTIGATLTGAITGIVLGSFAFGGLIGWALNKLARVPYPWADVIGLAIVAGASGFTNSSPQQPMTTTWLMYGAGAAAAFFLLVMYHRAGRREAEPTSRQEPTA